MARLIDLFRPSPSPSPISRADLDAFMQRMLGLLGEVPYVDLTLRERKIAGSYNFAESWLVAYEVQGALQRHPELFPDHAHEAEHLCLLGQRAGFWLGLRNLFADLTQRCDVQYQMNHACRVRRALQLLAMYRHLAQFLSPDKDPQAERRQEALATAEEARASWQGRVHRAPKKKRPWRP